MTKDKQIEEMAQDICRERTCPTKCNGGNCYKKCKAHIYAERAFEAGYRKQSEGEWLNGVNGSKVCSLCGKEPLYTKSGTVFATTFYRVKSNFCPECGAKMKGAE